MNAKDFFVSRGVTRLCHFTKFNKFTEMIAPNCNGIEPTNLLREDIKEPVDKNRYDGRADSACSCSVEYPNCWYLREAMRRDNNPLFKDWLVIFIDLDIFTHRNAEFCPCNAAKKHGEYIFQDIDRLDLLYAESVLRRRRTSNMLSCCPTDDQAEILIHGNIPCEFFTGYAVGSQNMADRLLAALRMYGRPEAPIYLAPDILTEKWSGMVRRGIRPVETRI